MERANLQGLESVPSAQPAQQEHSAGRAEPHTGELCLCWLSHREQSPEPLSQRAQPVRAGGLRPPLQSATLRTPNKSQTANPTQRGHALVRIEALLCAGFTCVS